MMRSSKGFTLIETAVALGVAAIGSFLILKGMDSMRDLTEETLLLSSNERQIHAIADNLRTGIEQHQINFDYSDASTNRELKLEDLPMAWDVGQSAPKEECKNCRGRYGYTIQVLERYRGLYQVTLRVTHKEWREPFRDYKFVVTVK